MGRSGVVGYRCPKPIFEAWQRLLIAAGDSIEDYREEPRYPKGCDTTGVNRYWNVVSSDRSSTVTFGYPLIEPQSVAFQLIGYQLVLAWPRESRELAATIERMLLASGAVGGKPPFSCRTIYRCENEAVDAILASTSIAGHPLTILHEQRFAPGADDSTAMTYYEGLVNHATASVSLFTGPAVDPDIGRLTHYVALGVSRPWRFFRRRRTEELFSELDAWLRRRIGSG
jgi:hypothetical protein